MARCLRPLTIKRPGLADAPHNLPRYGRENLRPYLNDTVVVPCGKCLACLKNRQSQMVVRCKREAEKRGTFGFMTLTYDEDHLPVTRSVWRVDKETGEQDMVSPPDFVSTGFHPDAAVLCAMRQAQPGTCARYVVTQLVEDARFSYEARMTPSVCRLDVRSWLKQARIQWQRDHGEPLPDFSYVAISEYGPRTCRPHYHLAFFGLKKEHLFWLLDRWRFGDVKRVQMVNAINPDHSSGFTRASQYIGKYMSKGKFECDSVKEGASEKPRVCQSIGVGTSDLGPLRSQVLAFDMFGEYDPDTLRRPDGSLLPRSSIERLVEEIPRRLVYLVCPELRDSDGNVLQNEVKLPLPRIIRDKIFKKPFGNENKKTSTTLWAMVASSLRDKFAREDNEQYRQFCAERPGRAPAEMPAEFAYFQAFCASLQEASMYQDYQSFYGKSQF